jgi:hypothetical protein
MNGRHITCDVFWLKRMYFCAADVANGMRISPLQIEGVDFEDGESDKIGESTELELSGESDAANNSNKVKDLDNDTDTG